MNKLKFAADLSLPIEAVTQKLGWLGTTGSGKTYGATRLAESMWDAGAQFVVLDPVGVWYGLRLAKDGERPSNITIPIFGGLHGDVPLESTSGAQIANVIVDRGISAILDVSQFESDAAKARFATDFGDRFFFRKKASPSAVHIFLEECQEFIPEHQQRGEERMLHVWQRVQKIGRNFGIGTSLITQRPQEVAKKALNLAQTLFVFRTTGSHERASIERWIKDKAIVGQDVSAELPKLKTGQPHVWSPEWLELSRVVSVLEKRTYNASATPEVGVEAKRRDLAAIDLAKIQADIADSIERAKADDPRELKKRIAELERQVRAARPSIDNDGIRELKKEEYQRGLIDGRREGQVDYDRVSLAYSRLLNSVESYQADAKRIADDANSLQSGLSAALNSYGDALVRSRREQAERMDQRPARRPVAAPKPQNTVAQRAPSQAPSVQVDGIPRAAQKLLDAAAQFAALNIHTPTRTQVAGLARVSIKSSSTDTGFGFLVKNGLFDTPSDGSVKLTAAGKRAAATIVTPPSLDSYIDNWRAILDGAALKLFDAMLGRASVMKPIERSELARLANISFTSSSTDTGFGKLLGLDLLKRAGDGLVEPGPTMFPEGLL